MQSDCGCASNHARLEDGENEICGRGSDYGERVCVIATFWSLGFIVHALDRCQGHCVRNRHTLRGTLAAWMELERFYL